MRHEATVIIRLPSVQPRSITPTMRFVEDRLELGAGTVLARIRPRDGKPSDEEGPREERVADKIRQMAADEKLTNIVVLWDPWGSHG